MDEKNNIDKEINDSQLSEILVQDEFKDFYKTPLSYACDLLNKEQILKKYKKIKNLLEIEE